MNYTALYDEDATEEDQIECYQHLVNSGDAWRLEGHVGRTAMGLLTAGTIMLGKRAVQDYYGSTVPARDQVKPGTKGSYQLTADRYGKEYADRLAAL